MKIEIAITTIAIVSLSIMIHGGAFGFYEDQMKICNFEHVCQIVNIDDYMTKQSSDKLQNNFNKELDTFNDKNDIYQQLDDICRDQYYKFCLGSSWNSLGDALLN